MYVYVCVCSYVCVRMFLCSCVCACVCVNQFSCYLSDPLLKTSATKRRKCTLEDTSARGHGDGDDGHLFGMGDDAVIAPHTYSNYGTRADICLRLLLSSSHTRITHPLTIHNHSLIL